MKKLVLLLVAAFVSVLLLSAAAFASPLVISPVETPPPIETLPPVESKPPVESEPPVVSEPPAPPVELEEPPEEVEIDEPFVPLADVPSPQTGVVGLSGMEVMGLMAAALSMSGTAVLAKARKQTC